MKTITEYQECNKIPIGQSKILLFFLNAKAVFFKKKNIEMAVSLFLKGIPHHFFPFIIVIR